MKSCCNSLNICLSGLSSRANRSAVHGDTSSHWPTSFPPRQLLLNFYDSVTSSHKNVKNVSSGWKNGLVDSNFVTYRFSGVTGTDGSTWSYFLGEFPSDWCAPNPFVIQNIHRIHNMRVISTHVHYSTYLESMDRNSQ